MARCQRQSLGCEKAIVPSFFATGYGYHCLHGTHIWAKDRVRVLSGMTIKPGCSALLGGRYFLVPETSQSETFIYCVLYAPAHV